MTHTKKLDLVLVNPASRTQVYQSLGSELSAVENPLWASLMAAFCRHRGLSVAIVDAEAEQLSTDDVAQRVDDINAILAVVVVYGHQPSASTQIMSAAGQVCNAIKQQSQQQTILLVGGHVAALPERTLNEECADFVAGGDGLHTMVELVAALKTSCPDYSKVAGLWYRRNGKAQMTRDRPLVTDLNAAIPNPTWDLLPMDRYRAHNWHCLDGRDRQPYAAIYTTLGCPYHCSFCCIQAPFRNGEAAAGIKATTNSYRYWSPETVLSQIDVLVNQYGVSNIKIADEMFVLNRKHVLAICEGLIHRNYGLNLWAYARVDTIKNGMLETMRQAGFSWLALGIESGTEHVRADVDKRFTQQEVFEVVSRIRNAGINVIGNYIFGLPDDNQDSMQATFDLATELNCEFANFYSTMAYPGSPLYQQALNYDVPLPRNWNGYAQHSRDCLPLPTRHLTSREVLKFRDEAFQRYYTNPHYLTMIKNRFGEKVVSEIRNMTNTRLRRDLCDGTMDVPLVHLPTASPSRSRSLIPMETC